MKASSTVVQPSEKSSDLRYRVVLFFPLPDDEDGSRSRKVPMPGAADVETAWQTLFRELQQRPEYIGGTIEAVAQG